MRIQPHIWAHPTGGDRQALTADVVTNSVATHGHLRGVLGAVFHANCLLHALDHGEVPGPSDWEAIALGLHEVGAIAESSSVLGELWLGQWELHSGKRFADEVEVVAQEIQADLQLCRDLEPDQGAGGYNDAVEALEAYRPEQRGSGTKTSILAALAAWLFADRPLDAVLTCANRLGTDTDTVATMAGAITGAVARDEPEGDLADRDYILHEADRMWALSLGATGPAFQYPNLVTWAPPKSATDCVGETDEGVQVAGLGPSAPDPAEFAPSGKAPAVWQWLTLWFGQRVLAKRRPRLTPLASFQRVTPTQQYFAVSAPKDDIAPKRAASETIEPPLTLLGETVPATVADSTLHELTDRVIASEFDPAVVGQALLSLADRSDGIESALAYAAIITKARRSRLDRERRRNGKQD